MNGAGGKFACGDDDAATAGGVTGGDSLGDGSGGVGRAACDGAVCGDRKIAGGKRRGFDAREDFRSGVPSHGRRASGGCRGGAERLAKSGEKERGEHEEDFFHGAEADD